MEYNTKLQARVVCKQWFEFLKTTDARLYFAGFDDVDEITHHFTNTRPIYSLTLLKSKADELYFARLLSPMTQLTSLKIGLRSNYKGLGLAYLTNLLELETPSVDLYTLATLTNLKKLKTDVRVHESETHRVLSSIEEFNGPSHFPFLSLLNPDKLTHLGTPVIYGGVTSADLARFSNLRNLSIDASVTQHPLSIGLPNLESLNSIFATIGEIASTGLTELLSRQEKPLKIKTMADLKKLQVEMGSIPHLNQRFEEMVNLEWLRIDGEDCSSHLWDNIHAEKLTKFTCVCYSQAAEKLRRFTNLEKLSVTNLSIGDELRIPSEFQNQLTALDIIAKEIDLNSVQQLTNLKSLKIQFGTTNGSLDVQNLSILTQLTISAPDIQIINLSALQNLKLLSVSKANFDYNGLRTLTNLTKLVVKPSFNLWTNLTKLTVLQSLVLADHYHADILPLTAMQNLTSLVVAGDHQGVDNLANLLYLTQLQCLVYSPEVPQAKELRDALIEYLPYLHHLQLDFPK